MGLVTKPKRTRWVCPECDDAILAPTRLRKIDTRRYCLPCSGRTGKLVERTTPVLDRRRAAQAAKRSETAKERQARADEKERARLTVGGFYLPDEAARLWKTRALRETPGWIPALPKITFRRGTKERSSGRCWYGTREIVVTAGTDSARARETVAHELVHAVLRGEGHSSRFWSVLRAVAREAWPEVEFKFELCPIDRGWRVDRWIADRIRATEESTR